MGYCAPRETLIDVQNKIKTERKKKEKNNDSTLFFGAMYTRHLTTER